MLESRTLMSASGEVMQPDIVHADTSLDASDIQGYTPAQIDKAYGFDSIALSNGVTADGAGQTIAIVDAYSDPKIAADTAVFDSEFDLPAINLKVVSQTGSTSSLPASNAGWAGEISLDVEWAHAIAPGATILLVEASSDNTDDLMAAVNYARNAAGVSVVSMSWGGSEFFDWGNGGESDSQLTYDADFTTPAGHQGVTFIAAAGDSGAQSGVQWPASSPNVVSVGGTTLYTSDSTGTYDAEAGWTGTSSGYSQVEAEPAYQDVVQDSGERTVADVSYDADPNTGFPIYDSVAYEGESGWQEIGGTSAGTPQWAALVAIADQGRTADNLDTLDGATQTLPTLYSLYSAPGTTDYSTYTTYFNDVTSGGGNNYRFRWGGQGNSAGSAGPGYDLVTGLGTPIAYNLVDALVGTTSSSSGGSTTTGGGSGGSTSPSEQAPSPLSAIVTSKLPTSIIGGVAGTLNVGLTNISGINLNAPVSITLYASTTSALSSDATTIITMGIPDLSLNGDKSKVEKIEFDYPTTLSGSYYLIASVTVSDTDTAAATAVTSKTVAIAEPTVDLGVEFSKNKLVKVKPGKNDTATLVITNTGNVTASGTLSLNLVASTDGLLDTLDLALASIANRKIKIGAGKSISLSVKFTAPADLTAGSYDLIASISADTTTADSDSANSSATIGTTS
jgi:subtilase family serine protease